MGQMLEKLDENGLLELGLHRKSLRVLVVDSSESTNHITQILAALTKIGHKITAVESVTTPSPVDGLLSEASTALFLDQITRCIADDPPDVLISAMDSPELFRRIIDLMPPQTRILDSLIVEVVRGIKDSLVLDVVRGIREISGQLAATRTKLQKVELIKEVLMSGPGISLMVVDEELEIVEISNSILERARMARDDCIGRPCHWVLRKGMKPCHCTGESCVALEVLRTGRSVHTVKESGSSEDSRHYFTVSGYPLKTDEDGKENVLIVWKDINQEMTQVLNRQARNIQQNFLHTLEQDKMVALGQLAAAAVHEINNPIQGILTFAKLMRLSCEKDSLSSEELEKFRSYLDLIAGESARCGQILRNLLSFARLENMEKSVFDFNRVLDDVFMLVQNRAGLQGITLDTCIDDGLLPIFGDRGHIKQALLNLVINALDAMPNGGVMTVSARMDEERNYVRILVSDTGVGIPKFIQGSIWEPFVTTKAIGKGVGLGLSVVYGIVTQHGGTVDMQSEENKGTAFGVNLPAFKGEQEHKASYTNARSKE